jgi:hypothetical protein
MIAAIANSSRDSLDVVVIGAGPDGVIAALARRASALVPRLSRVMRSANGRKRRAGPGAYDGPPRRG